jgi:starch phosphorylase
VQNAHLIYPAANLSEQISTAGKEASGTGNMKFMINGALTIGTLDGANVEMLEEAGAENFFLFGLNEEDVARVYAEGYRPASYIERDPELADVLDLIAEGHFTDGDPEILRPVVESLRYHDPFLVCADYRSFVDCQAAVGDAWQDAEAWSRMSILNAARSGKFSSDRAIAQYCDEFWGVAPMKVQV